MNVVGRKLSVGVCGCGIVGQVLTNNLLRGGHYVNIYDINPCAVSALQEKHPTARSVPTSADLAKMSDIVLTCLPRPEHVNDAMHGADGLLAGLSPGKIWIEHSTTDYQNLLILAKQVEEKECSPIESPLTGGITLLKEGNMIALVGGEKSSVESITGLLELSVRKAIHCGEMGHATIVKILSNMLCATMDCAMGEAICIAKKGGVDLQLLFDAIRASSGNSFCWETEYPLVCQGNFYPDFTAKMMRKDLDLGQNLSRRFDVPTPVHDMVSDIYDECIVKYGEDSGSTIPVRLAEDKSNTSLRDSRFDNWTYTTDYGKGSMTICHKNIENPFTNM